MTASWYGPKFHGKVTANGEIYNQMALTAAHKSLPFGTMLRLTNEKNGKSVIVRINDRGPYIKGRQIDLSKAAAIELGAIERGVVKVKVEKLVLQKNNTPYYAVN
ncbi:MAG: septal ring lytic transglycosylase RlpA family protein [Melioribacteraceae bacterium]|nr:septal ring lytic transglycosylase RlpA family protein [Melioribacteraceae bacterium]MCF8356499.1 septal ring lytic transglycosylase RlpA family protein [Melioribacteraceae bacterium]MCF8395887.1 septal ring lytic transglycosylase RlpA family protein [Melioribacteraceae bacterium]MCF8420950.1 septal ring lytic transglycosylase RlpA family protein [Melioribacteraceae bacterium]